MVKKTLFVKYNSDKAKLPEIKTKGSLGYDLSSIENCVIKAGKFRLIKTGLSIALPVGYEAQIRPRSGLALKFGITVLNSPGTIDSDYRGEIGIILVNFGEEDFHVEEGMRIAQMVIAKCEIFNIEEVDDLESSDRDSGGFGSTGMY